MTIFLATLGQRPEAITMALDVLFPRYHYDTIHIIHTDIHESGIADAYKRLMNELMITYPSTSITHTEICYKDSRPLIDIQDQYSAEIYYQGILNVMRDYRIAYLPMHLLISGGRKAMSVYATLGAVLLFGEYDYVWTIHTPPALMQSDMFHVPPGSHDQIQLIQLPIRASRLLPGMIAEKGIDQLLSDSHTKPRDLFMASLTREEKALTRELLKHHYATNAALAGLLNKSTKTIEHQLRGIYSKLLNYFDLDIEHKQKRQVLLDVLAGRV